MAAWLMAIPVSWPRAASASEADDVLDVDVLDARQEAPQERDRIVAGDEGVAGVEVEAEVGAVAEAEHLLQHVGLGGEVAVDLDVDRRSRTSRPSPR
jgi:hypothetical protein